MTRKKIRLIAIFAPLWLMSCSTTISDFRAIPTEISSSEWDQLSSEQKLSAREVELLSLVNAYLDERGFRLGRDALELFWEKIDIAALEIENEPPNRRSDLLRQFEGNTKLVIDTMIGKTAEIPNYTENYYRVIGEETWAMALRDFCPVWPFCTEPSGD